MNKKCLVVTLITLLSSAKLFAPAAVGLGRGQAPSFYSPTLLGPLSDDLKKSSIDDDIDDDVKPFDSQQSPEKPLSSERIEVSTKLEPIDTVTVKPVGLSLFTAPGGGNTSTTVTSTNSGLRLATVPAFKGVFRRTSSSNMSTVTEENKVTTDVVPLAQEIKKPLTVTEQGQLPVTSELPAPLTSDVQQSALPTPEETLIASGEKLLASWGSMAENAPIQTFSILLDQQNIELMKTTPEVVQKQYVKLVLKTCYKYLSETKRYNQGSLFDVAMNDLEGQSKLYIDRVTRAFSYYPDMWLQATQLINDEAPPGVEANFFKYEAKALPQESSRVARAKQWLRKSYLWMKFKVSVKNNSQDISEKINSTLETARKALEAKVTFLDVSNNPQAVQEAVTQSCGDVLNQVTVLMNMKKPPFTAEELAGVIEQIKTFSDGLNLDNQTHAELKASLKSMLYSANASSPEWRAALLKNFTPEYSSLKGSLTEIKLNNSLVDSPLFQINTHGDSLVEKDTRGSKNSKPSMQNENTTQNRTAVRSVNRLDQVTEAQEDEDEEETQLQREKDAGFGGEQSGENDGAQEEVR